MKTLLVCEECGGTNVQTKAWVDANSNKYISNIGEGDKDDNWCEDCQCHVGLEPKNFETEDYENNNEILFI